MAKFPYAAYFGEVNLLAELQHMPGEKRYIDKPAAGAAEPEDLLLYLGCNILRTAHLAKTVIAVLEAMGVSFNAAGGPAHCCGIVHHQHGDEAAAQRIAANSMRHFAEYGARHVLMWCPSCNEQYDEVVSVEQDVAFAYEHVTAFIVRHLDRIRFVNRVEKRVALHTHGGFAQIDSDLANIRTILGAIPGLELVELPLPAGIDALEKLGRHCAPKWINRLGRPNWQNAIAGTLENAKAAGVDVLATMYHSCQRELCGHEGSYPFAIVNWVSLLGEAMGIVHDDVYKRLTLAGDPNAAMAELQPFVAANDLDLTRVRDLVERTFPPTAAAEKAP